MTAILSGLALASAAGVNAYATLLVLGILVRTGAIPLQSPTAQFFGHTWVLAGLAMLYTLEFVADKVPTVDHAWDAVHTFIRPLAGAAAAVAVVSGHHDQGWVVLAAVFGGVTSLLFHGVKATARVGVTAATGGTGNWFVSILEDIGVVGTSLAALLLPVLAVLVAATVLTWLLWRRRRACSA